MNFVLPLPETTNHIYRSGGGHWYKSEKQKSWEEESSWVVKKLWRGEPIKENIFLRIDMYLKRERDIDGGIKPILDLFQRMGVYENDSQVTSMIVTKKFDKMNPRVEVEIGVDSTNR